MGAVFNPPKYTPPPEQGRAEELLEERESRAEAAERRERRKLASRARARRTGGRLLFSQDRVVPQLGVPSNLSPVSSFRRNPYETERMM